MVNRLETHDLDKEVSEEFDRYLERLSGANTELKQLNEASRKLAYSAYLYGVGYGMQLAMREIRREVVPRASAEKPEAVHDGGEGPGGSVPEE